MPWLSLPDYARQTGTPESTVRAAIRKGTLEAHREARAPGDPRDIWKVWLDEPADASTEQPQASTAPETSQPQTTLTEPPAATTRALEILETLLRANGETMERQAETIAGLRERVGRSEAARAAAERQVAEMAERLAGVERERDQLRARRWRWWPW
jgi:hypothetical protein